MKRVLAAVTVCAMAGAGCGSARPLPSSRGAFEALSESLGRDDGAAEVYAMLPASERAAVTLREFTERWTASREERQRAASAARTVLRAAAPVATVPGPDHDLTLVEEQDGWRVGDPLMGPAAGARVEGRSGARAALRGLRLALRRRDLPAVMASLSSRLRGAIEAELAAVLAALEDPDALDVLQIPGAAPVRVPLGDGRAVVLVREDGQWRIDDIVGP